MYPGQVPLVPNPGISIVGIDPGGTTGLAIWDAWDRCWYYDQLDAGRGRRVKQKVHAGVVESKEHQAVARALGLVTKQGNARLKAKNDPRVVDAVEYGCTQLIIDVLMAVGPGAIVVIEDFVLGFGNPKNAGSSGREGLAPVRMIARILQEMQNAGIQNGDAWRLWGGFGSASKDQRGVVVRRPGGVGLLLDRVHSVRHWRETGEMDHHVDRPNAWDVVVGDDAGSVGDVEGREVSTENDGAVPARSVLWRGGGSHLMYSMPSAKASIPDAMLQEWELWWPGHRHAMDALKHAVIVCRRLGTGFQGEWRTLFRQYNSVLSRMK